MKNKRIRTSRNHVLKIIGRIAAVITANLILTAICLYGVMFVLVYGPSETARNLFVLSVKETSAAGFLADLYLSHQEIAEILSSKAAVEVMEQASGNKTDASLISIPKESKPADESSVITETTSAPVTEISETKAPDPGGKDSIEVEEITGTTYKGTMLIVSDPKRIILGALDAYGEDKTGLSLREMIDKYGAIAGINAGGFIDPNGQGTGGIPSGIVIKNGKILWGSAAEKYSVIGFDADGILHAGTMTGQEALDAGVTEGVSFGPALIINGIPCNKNSGLGGGFNPRTAIGQRSDGAVLLVVIEGRNLGSLGATYDDLVEVMLANGAVNASNLDGGSSSLMLYEGSTLTKSAYVYGERVLATAFLVKQVTD